MKTQTQTRQLSTAEERRETVLRTAISAFADRGYYGTPTTDIAKEAGISQAYLYRLFPTKEALFVAVVARCFARIRASLADGATRARTRTQADTPRATLDAMGEAYACLIADRELLLLQMQAHCAASVPAIRDALREGYSGLVEYVRTASGAGDAEVQEFFALGALCNVVVAMSAETVDARWARTLSAGLRHF